jgi:hypothetical protein
MKIEEVKRIYNVAESIITLTGSKVIRLDIQSYKLGDVEGYVGYLDTDKNKRFMIRMDGTFKTI